MATIDIATLATALDTDPRTARKFMRSITPRDSQPGKGARWSIEKRAVRSLQSKFTKWGAEQEAKRLEREVNKARTADAPVDEDLTNEVDEEPTDEELALLEDEAITD